MRRWGDGSCHVRLYHPMEVGFWAQQYKAGTLNKGEKPPRQYRGNRS